MVADVCLTVIVILLITISYLHWRSIKEMIDATRDELYELHVLVNTQLIKGRNNRTMWGD